MTRVYYPLFQDMNHRLLLARRGEHLPDSDWIDVRRMLDEMATNGYSKTGGSYFRNAEQGRARFATKLWEDKEKGWTRLTAREKEAAGRERARIHNKVLEYSGTLRYNMALFDEIIHYCTNRGIKVVMAICPATEYYRKYLSPEFKRTYLEVLERAGGKVAAVDFFDHPAFLDEDFNDMDHLSAAGARKLTAMLKDVVEGLDG